MPNIDSAPGQTLSDRLDDMPVARQSLAASVDRALSASRDDVNGPVGHPSSASISDQVAMLPSSSSLTVADPSRVLAALAEWRGAPVTGSA